MGTHEDDLVNRLLKPTTEPGKQDSRDRVISPSAAAFSGYDGDQLRQMAAEPDTDPHAMAANTADGLVDWTERFGDRQFSPQELEILRLGAAMGACAVLKAHDVARHL